MENKISKVKLLETVVMSRFRNVYQGRYLNVSVRC
jgi:hypothetical protein